MFNIYFAKVSYYTFDGTDVDEGRRRQSNPSREEKTKRDPYLSQKEGGEQ